MRRYETTYIIDSTLEPDKIEGITGRVSDIISRFKGKIIGEKRWGKRRLAYEIDKRQYGYYILVNYEAESAVVAELERFLRLNQYVLRYLTIHFNQRELKLIELDEERKRKEEEQALAAVQATNKIKE